MIRSKFSYSNKAFVIFDEVTGVERLIFGKTNHVFHKIVTVFDDFFLQLLKVKSLIGVFLVQYVYSALGLGKLNGYLPDVLKFLPKLKGTFHVFGRHDVHLIQSYRD